MKFQNIAITSSLGSNSVSK